MKKLSELKFSHLSGVIQRALCALATFLVVFALLIAGVTPDQYDIHVGQPASKSIYATKDVEDSVTTQALREAAANAVEPSYKSADMSVNSTVLTAIERTFSALTSLRSEYQDANPDDVLQTFNSRSPVTLTRDMLSALLSCDETQLTELSDAAEKAMRDTLNATLPEGQEAAAITRITRDLSAADYPAGLVSVAAEVLRACVKPNMLIDTEITEANREKARAAVEPEMVVKRQIIVGEGQIVTEAQYQMIASLGLLQDDRIDLPLYGGLALTLIALFLAAAFYLEQYDRAVLESAPHLLLLCIIAVLEVGISLLVGEASAYLMPVAMSTILIAILIGKKTAIFFGSGLGFVVSMLASADSLFSMEGFCVILTAFVSAPLVVYILRRNQLRSGALIAGCTAGLVNFLITLAVGFISSLNLRTAMISALWAFGGGIISAVFSIGLQALLEWLFNLATTAKLIELSNPNQPLLRRLLLEAPGTYHHSIIVANLAEAAAAAVGANGLLARVGAYYHDIGKLKRPMYFKENQLSDNPHDRTDPRVSTAILIAHPRDGAQMALKARIPMPIVDIIRQHHGDSLVLYFYDKAVKLYGSDVDIASFRYEGPRPRTREAAVVMLADTIEAATRAQVNPTPEKMEQLIRKLVREKLDDGQLNDCPLTFNDLDKICATFCTVLTGVFHERIEYPDVVIPPRTSEPAPEATDGEAEASEPDNSSAEVTENAD